MSTNRPNSKAKVRSAKEEKAAEKYKSSRFYPREIYLKGFNKVFALEREKHTNLPTKRLSQEILGTNAYQLIDNRPITQHEYADILETLNDGNDVNHIKIKLDEFKRVLPRLKQAMPQNVVPLTAIITDWERCSKKVIDLRSKMLAAKATLEHRDLRLKEAEKNNYSIEVREKLDNQRTEADIKLHIARAQLTKEQAELFKFEILGVFKKEKDKDFIDFSDFTKFTDYYSKTHQTIKAITQNVIAKQNTPAKAGIEVANKELLAAESSFQSIPSANLKKKKLYKQVLPFIIHQRVMEIFEKRKDKAIAGVILNIQKFIAKEYSGGQTAAAGLAAFQTLLMGTAGSLAYRLFFRVLANLDLKDDRESRLFSHPEITERGQQEALNLWRNEVIRNEECNIRVMSSLPATLDNYLNDYIWIKNSAGSHFYFIKKEDQPSHSEKEGAQKIIATELTFPMLPPKKSNESPFNTKDSFEKILTVLMEGRVYKHLNIAAVNQLFNPLTIERQHGQVLFARMPFVSGTSDRFYDTKSILNSVPHLTSVINWCSDNNKYSALKTPKIEEKEIEEKAIKIKEQHSLENSSNLYDHVNKQPTLVQSYKKIIKGMFMAVRDKDGKPVYEKGKPKQRVVKAGKWVKDGDKKEELLEERACLQHYNRFIADFENIPKESTLKRPEPNNLIPAKDRHNLVKQIINPARKPLKPVDKTEKPKVFPKEGRALAVKEDKVKEGHRLAMKRISTFKTYPAVDDRAFRVRMDKNEGFEAHKFPRGRQNKP